MLSRPTFLTAIFLMATLPLFSQINNNLQTPTSINTDGAPPDESAMLDVQSTTQGMLVPRMTTGERTAITSPAEGLLVFDINTDGFWFFNGTEWQSIGGVQGGSPALITDADGDTKIEVEKTADADSVHFTVDGNQVGVMDGRTFHFTSPGLSLFMGLEAGLNDDGSDNRNVFIGPYTGLNTTTGNLNTFIGTEAGVSNTEGFFNTFLGQAAGLDNTTGSHNTFLGQGTGWFNMEGSFNTYFGQDAGRSNTIGSNNTYLGFSTGSLNLAGSGNVFIGNQAGTNETGSQRLYIDNGPTAEPLIFGEFDNDLLRVNGKLEVTGDIKIENSGSTSPEAGTIRWNETIQDFEGYTGTGWKSLTQQGNTWGNMMHSSTENGQGTASDGATEDRLASASPSPGTTPSSGHTSTRPAVTTTRARPTSSGARAVIGKRWLASPLPTGRQATTLAAASPFPGTKPS